MSKPSIGRMGVALLLLYGIVPVLAGYILMREWAAERMALVACAAIFLLSGTTMLVCALCLLVAPGHQRVALWSGGIASILSGSVLAGATFTHVLPCSGPA